MSIKSSKGFSAVEAILIVIVIAIIGFAGWFVWQKSRKDQSAPLKTQEPNSEVKTDPKNERSETDDWTLVTTQGNSFSMRVPDGWRLASYSDDYIGGTEVVYKAGVRADITTPSAHYAGHTLRFRASIGPLDDAGLGPQWSSPQTGLQESTQDYELGSLKGKRFKGTFSQDLNQTIYEYVFSVGNGKKLDIVYVIDHGRGDKDEIDIVEKAIKTIDLKP